MSNYPHEESVWVRMINLMTLVYNDEVKTAMSDVFILANTITHGLWAAKYDELLGFFFIDGCCVNAACTALAFIRLCILLDKR